MTSTSTPARALAGEYVMPLRWAADGDSDDLTAYLDRLTALLPVTVVDGSAEPLFSAHHHRWSGAVRHVRPEPWPGRNGKVAGVMTGIRLARCDKVVLADDDVRYDAPGLAQVLAHLDHAELVRPQNYFAPLPWHARWDTARTLVNRAFGGDYPGTFGVRRSALLAAGGYDGDVLFENLELIRTVQAARGTVVRADGLYVARRPPTARHFWSQRLRQAYDSQAQPGRLAVELTLGPTLLWSLRHRPAAAAVLGLGVAAIAERGRRRAGGAAVFPLSAALLAPVWLVERAVCVWGALALRLTGGVRYAGGRLSRAATPTRHLRRRNPDVD